VPVDYYTVFSELEAQLANEFDFEAEAKAMDVIGHTLRKFQVNVCKSE
jgi:aarF domain-containing kinase